MIARLPNGAVVLPGLDTAMSEYAWSALDDAHPQAGLARLLQGLGAARGDVRAWPAAAPEAARAARARDTVAGAAAGERAGGMATRGPDGDRRY